jgi:diguanylate cyclase (GGDEF)-like protein/PAS domain S-box-containing protein
MVQVEGISSSEALIEVLDSFSQAVLVTNPDRKIVYCNPAFTTMTGYALAEILGRSSDLLHGPETSPNDVERLSDCVARTLVFKGEVLNYRKDGSAFWNDLTVIPVMPDGHLRYYLGLLSDVTLRHAAEHKLAEAVAYHRSLFDHMQSAIVVHGPDTQIRYANATAIRMLGLADQEVVGAPATDPRWIFYADDETPMRLADFPVTQAVTTKRHIRDLMVGVRRGDETTLSWLLCDALPVIAETGELTEIVVSFTDVTALKRAQQVARKSEERLRLVLQGSNDASWDWDVATGEVYYSPRWWNMLGIDLDAPPTNEELWRTRLHPEDRASVEGKVAEFLPGNIESFELEFRMLHSDGHYVPILSRGFVLRDAAGKPIRLSGTNTDLTERKRAEERVHYLAYYDTLTDLPNRQLLMVQLRRALQSCAQTAQFGALLLFDLDRFKLLNDTLGHYKGDRLLKLVAARVRTCVRDSDVLARFGGDKFIVMCENLGADADAATAHIQVIGGRILAGFNEPFPLDGTPFRTSCSIGVALFDPTTTSDDDVLKRADLAMYEVKASGRNALRFFDRSMQTAIDARTVLEKDLREALDRDELVLHFQPQLDQHGKVVGAEALVRWQHPRRGLLSPAEFIPLAEETNLIQNLGSWVLRTGCRTLREWEGRGPLGHLWLSVNVSAAQIYQPGFDRQVIDLVEKSGIRPETLKLELTESLLATNIEKAIESMASLRAHGIRFSLDDFGTGYSSLGYLQRLPLNEIKIDRSFVRDVLTNPNDATIARIIISLAKQLGLAVVAEGIEDEGQLQFLRAEGCEFFQGYLLGRPVPIREFEKRVAGK